MEQTASGDTPLFELDASGWKPLATVPVSQADTQLPVSASELVVFVHREIPHPEGRNNVEYRLWRAYRQSHGFAPEAIDTPDWGGVHQIATLTPDGSLRVVPRPSALRDHRDPAEPFHPPPW